MRLVVKGVGLALLAAFAAAAATVTAPSRAAGGYSGNESARGRPVLTLSVARQSLADVRGQGLKVQASCNVPCIASVQARKGSKALGAGRRRLPLRRGTVKVRFNRAGKQRLRSSKSIKLSLRGTAVNDANARSAVARASVKLK